ncbi:MAG TPA: hypothetical protein VI935_01140 [Thermodesulfobacteriota bacterium]|nr:hypothetical protein [Thermodesulfobacteriota bacterium]
MSVERIYCGIILEGDREIKSTFALCQFIAIAINAISANGIYVHPVIGQENGKTCLYIDKETTK